MFEIWNQKLPGAHCSFIIKHALSFHLIVHHHDQHAHNTISFYQVEEIVLKDNTAF